MLCHQRNNISGVLLTIFFGRDPQGSRSPLHASPPASPPARCPSFCLLVSVARVSGQSTIPCQRQILILRSSLSPSPDVGDPPIKKALGKHRSDVTTSLRYSN